MMISIPAELVAWAMILIPVAAIIPLFIFFPEETTAVLILIGLVLIFILALASVVQGLHILMPDAIRDHPFWK